MSMRALYCDSDWYDLIIIRLMSMRALYCDSDWYDHAHPDKPSTSVANAVSALLVLPSPLHSFSCSRTCMSHVTKGKAV